MSSGRLQRDGNPPRFAGPRDHAECRRLHRKYGSTYYFATRQFRPEVRRRVHALYGFVRVPDEWVDNPGSMGVESRAACLQDYRNQLIRACDGVVPDHPVLRAFADLMRDIAMPLAEPLLFLSAMEQDLTTTRYPTYQSLRDYMRGSASAVGVMMCNVLEAGEDPEMIDAACYLGEAMQLTNFLRDVGEDVQRGRIYLPLEDLASFGVAEEEIIAGEMSERFVRLLRFEIDRARALYARADGGIPLLPPEGRKAVKLARVLYSRILDRIEDRNYDVFGGRARTSTPEKIAVAARILAGLA